jgi:hypothetical protein
MGGFLMGEEVLIDLLYEKKTVRKFIFSQSF